MLDLACIFTTGGIVLFYKAFCEMKFDAIDLLIKKVLIQDKDSQIQYFVEPYIVKWNVVKELGLIFAVVYQELFQLSNMEDLITLIKDEYVAKAYPLITIENNFMKNIPSFETNFEEVQKMGRQAGEEGKEGEDHEKLLRHKRWPRN
jgi:signal recognition particle receptor subunit alpha